MEIGDIIYLLIIAFAVVASIIRQINKRNPQTPPKQTTAKKPSQKEKEMSTKEVLRELFGGDERHEFPTAQEVYRPKKQEVETITTTHKEISATPGSIEYELLKQGTDDKKEEKKRKISLDSDDEEEILNVELKDIDWRKAIIYSEILKPKY